MLTSEACGKAAKIIRESPKMDPEYRRLLEQILMLLTTKELPGAVQVVLVSALLFFLAVSYIPESLWQGTGAVASAHIAVALANRTLSRNS